MISFDDAVAIVLREARPLPSERVELASAGKRILSAPVVALVDSPPADVSAMDGYAFREADLPSARLAGASYPGAPYDSVLRQGECVRIFTGATIPGGADRVVIQENVTQEDDRILVTESLSPVKHIRRRASDFSAGDQILPAGRQLDPRALVAAAGADVAKVEVYARPRLFILGTGDELVEPGLARDRLNAIPESVSLGVAALAEDWGAEMIGRQRLRDDPQQMRGAAARALEQADVVVMTGGASVGEKDFAKSVFASLGVEMIFTKVAIKPGKPVWLGRLGSKLVMGLPGNPTSALVTARLLLAPLIAGLSGADPLSALRWRDMELADPLPPCGDRETFVRARRKGACATVSANQDSSAQRTLAEADLLIRRLKGADAASRGDCVQIIDF